jgi:hypothetical protein
MFILPFIHEVVPQNTFQVNIVKILTIGGQTLWEEENKLQLDSDILNPNDIYRKSTPIRFDKKLQLCEVDITKTNILDFYKWKELDFSDSETFCWRTFIYFANDGQSWLNIPDSEKIGNYSLKDIIARIMEKK